MAVQANPKFSTLVSMDFLKQIEISAMLHDIGKVGISDDILLKPGKLTPDERREMEQHPLISSQCLRRIEEKLDLLLDAGEIPVPRPLSGRDRRLIVFSGGGLALDADFDFARGDAYRVEMLLPAPYARIVRAVAEAVGDSAETLARSGGRRLALAFRQIQPAERDAVVAYGYDLQRIALRAKNDGLGVRP